MAKIVSRNLICLQKKLAQETHCKSSVRLKTYVPLEYTGKYKYKHTINARFAFFKEHSVIQKGLHALLQNVVTLSVQSVTPREISRGSFRLAGILKYSFVTL